MPQLHEYPQNVDLDSLNKHFIETPAGVVNYLTTEQLLGGLRFSGNSVARNLQYVPDGTSFTNKTTANGLGANTCTGVSISGSNVYVATSNGLAISTDGGLTFTNKTAAINGLASDNCYDVLVSGSVIYVCTIFGLSISINGGTSFTSRTTANGLGSNACNNVFVSGANVYVATDGGLSISTDSGTTFTNKTTANGLGNNKCNEVFVSGSTVYVATNGGLSISTDGGLTYTNKTTANGLGSNACYSVFVSGANVYVATNGGSSISTDSGATYTNYTTAAGLGNNTCYDVFVSGSNVYVGTLGGLSISTDSGATYTNYTTSAGLGNNDCQGIDIENADIYVATAGGLSISAATWNRINAGTGGVIEFDNATNSIDIYSAADGSAGSIATLTQLIGILTDRLNIYKPAYLQTQPTSWRADTHAGYGSTDTYIPYFTNVRVNNIVNSDITVTNNATNGCKVLINTAGLYSITFTWVGDSGGAGGSGISLNSTELTTTIGSISAATRLTFSRGQVVASDFDAFCNSVTLWLAVNDVIRPHTNGVTPGSTAQPAFNIVKIL